MLHQEPTQSATKELSRFLETASALERQLLREQRAIPTERERSEFLECYWDGLTALKELHNQSADFASLSVPEIDQFYAFTLRSHAFWRSRYKPHGYAGDYRLMEEFYDIEHAAGKSSSKTPAENFLDFVCASLQCVQLIHQRAKFYEEFIVSEFQDRRHCDVLDIGAGGMRYFRRALKRLNYPNTLRAVAYDQDITLPRFFETEIEPEASQSIECVCAPIKRVEAEIGQRKFDIVASLGLYDYLDQTSAKHLTNKLLSFLKPGGKVIIANITDAEARHSWFFREMMMDWHVVYRNRETLADLYPNTNKVELHFMEDVALGVGVFEE